MKKSKYKIIIVVLSVILLIIASRELAEPYRILGDCMEPAIMDRKLYFLNKISAMCIVKGKNLKNKKTLASEK